MTYTEAKAEVHRIISTLAEHVPEEILNPEATAVTELQQDIANDFYTVVVVGEFSRGKSTLLNALLGADILPTGVTPTTATINVLMYSEAPRMRVYGRDGDQKEKQLTPSSLQTFVADSDFDPDSVRYVEIGLPSSVLANGMVYVDTPGVDDLSQQRADITYRFLPRADAVICVMDSTAPVTRSEQEFLESAVLVNRIGRLLFVVNFADKLDDEDRDGLEELVQSRLANALGGERPPVFVLSAKRGSSRPPAPLAGESGLESLNAYLAELQSVGPQSVEKALGFLNRAECIIKRIEAAQERRTSIAQSTQNDLTTQLAALEEDLKERASRKQKIELWVNERENEMVAMVRGSLASFADELRNDVDEILEDYKGFEFKHLVERQIPGLIKRRCKNWIDSHGQPISSLLQQFTANLTEGLANEFRTHVPMLARHNASNHSFEVTIQLTAEDVKNARGKVGIAAAGAAALAMVIGAPIFVPFVTLAGYPILSEKWHEHQLSEAKAKLRPELRQALDKAISSFTANVIKAITDELHYVQREAEERYDLLLEQVAQQVRVEIVNRQNARLLAENSIDSIRAQGGSLSALRSELEQLRSSLQTSKGAHA
ncbi:MAG TPA: dynamin family protein [Candidatus Nanoarchaeia archaeon]|nr:dynamin family protein [Candidatus Nanoarchaeia archaeon]